MDDKIRISILLSTVLFIEIVTSVQFKITSATLHIISKNHLDSKTTNMSVANGALHVNLNITWNFPGGAVLVAELFKIVGQQETKIKTGESFICLKRDEWSDYLPSFLHKMTNGARKCPSLGLHKDLNAGQYQFEKNKNKPVDFSGSKHYKIVHVIWNNVFRQTYMVAKWETISELI